MATAHTLGAAEEDGVTGTTGLAEAAEAFSLAAPEAGENDADAASSARIVFQGYSVAIPPATTRAVGAIRMGCIHRNRRVSITEPHVLEPLAQRRTSQ